MRWMLRVAAGVALLGGLVLAGCGGNSNSSNDTAQLRLVNATNGYASLDLTAGTDKIASGVGTASASSYSTVSANSLSTMITSPGTPTALSTATRSLSKDTPHSLVAFGWAGALRTALIVENQPAAATGYTNLQVANLAIDAGPGLDVYLTGADEKNLDNAVALASVGAGATYSYTPVISGTYRLWVTAAGDKTDLRLNVPGLVLTSTQVATLILTPGPSGLMVNGLLAVQAGNVSALANTQARIRAVASVAGGAKVSMALGSTSLLSVAASPQIGDYKVVDAGSPATTLVVNGQPVTVANQTLAAGTDYTALVWGDPLAPQVTLVVDDNRLPLVSGNAKLRLINGLSGLNSPLTLTADFTALASNVAQGGASSYTVLAAGTGQRLDVNSAASTTPIFTVTDATLKPSLRYTVWVLGDSASPYAVVRKESP